MARKQTSTKVSRIAGKYMALGVDGVFELLKFNDDTRMSTAKDLVTLAASALSQDETKGPSAAQRRKKAMKPQDDAALVTEIAAILTEDGR